jgi:hypothetical protein
VVLIPLWAIATYAFARAFLTRSVTWSVATGIAAGAAVLAKYWSFFLLFGLIVAALADRRRLQFVKSPAPWIMTVVSFGIFLPHLIWLDANGYPTLAYARHRVAATWPDLEDALTNYTFGTIAYVAVPLVLLAILVMPTRQALCDTLLPSDDDRRFAAMIFWTPLLVAIPFALLTSTGVNALWTMSELSLFGVVLLSSPLVRFPRSAAAIVAMVAMLTSSGALLAAPFAAYWKNRLGIENHAAYTRQLAAEIVKTWRETTAQPLRYVASNGVITYSATFYIGSQALPISFSARTKLWWNTPEEVERFGVAIVCPVLDPACLAARDRMESGLTVARRVDVVIVPHWLGFAGASRSYVIDVVLPRPQ